jgi:hypothetical protein
VRQWEGLFYSNKSPPGRPSCLDRIEIHYNSIVRPIYSEQVKLTALGQMGRIDCFIKLFSVQIGYFLSVSGLQTWKSTKVDPQDLRHLLYEPKRINV